MATKRVNRVNNDSRPVIMQYITDKFNGISSEKGGTVGLVDIWDVQFEIQKVFNISDDQSQKLTWQLIKERQTFTPPAWYFCQQCGVTLPTFTPGIVRWEDSTEGHVCMTKEEV